uniref:receptor protein-tyrosine kinase n=1 Tax=Mastacembelus armatus TaxID=205130 RepID=A0A7N8XVZ4_9TELE
MIAALLLLCAVVEHGSNVVAAQSCVSSHKVECFVLADYLNASAPVNIEVCAGKNLIFSLEGFTDYPVCDWIRGKDVVTAVNGSRSIILSSFSEADSGAYTLSYETSSGTGSSLTVSLHVVKKRPTKPWLMLSNVNKPKSSPTFTCASEGCPKPETEWSSTGVTGPEIKSYKYYDKGVMCCATNTEGQECSKLYDYDLDLMRNDGDSNVTVSPDQPLLLRCRMRDEQPVWEKDSKTLDAPALACPTAENKICIRNDSHYGQMTYLFIKSASVTHSGTYTCRGKKNIMSVYVNVQAEGFLNVQLDKRKVIAVNNAKNSCLEASVSYHPMLQFCSWQAPNKIFTKCTWDTWKTKHRTVQLCGPLMSGDYKLHLEAGGQNKTKTISVCVVDTPTFSFKDVDNTFTLETVSAVPANYTWMACSLFNDSCDSESSWEVIQNGSVADSEFFCNKIIKSSLRRELAPANDFKFCITNSVGSWCKTFYSPPYMRMRVAPNPDNDHLMVLKVGSLLLLLTLVVVSVVLMYFVKKKKAQYEPQLQMIQMVGPSDNDYIYINFRNFEYDLKWEFPRENLELGKELGSGAFGMVVRATAYGISKPGVSQQVAVKMLKDTYQTVEKEALMSELKMLTHIGHHSNIVNLLGACTDSGPIYLIFQYCCYGDLLNYLKSNSERYHKSVTDAFNKDRFCSLYHNLQPRKNSSEVETTVDNYVPMSCSTTRGQEDIALLTLSSSDGNIYEDMCESPDDQTEDLHTLTFDDLLSFAFQVAKGMEFLSSKNCLVQSGAQSVPDSTTLPTGQQHSLCS